MMGIFKLSIASITEVALSFGDAVFFLGGGFTGFFVFCVSLFTIVGAKFIIERTHPKAILKDALRRMITDDVRSGYKNQHSIYDYLPTRFKRAELTDSQVDYIDSIHDEITREVEEQVAQERKTAKMIEGIEESRKGYLRRLGVDENTIARMESQKLEYKNRRVLE